ncbi:hypothetical protein DFH07DRAFT_913080 [Mycena maculata]|uniref:Amidohydrolase-related domain-containing protein n=1 Tax=Mycena maculata TaxID=230809 RepID=A0AAD7NS98_9AGAR|nr:hypothetical protein DFH07DRAFT_913080 [Mycena maculata]
MTSTSILLSNGTVLLHDGEDRVHAIAADVLIIDNRIVEVAPGIASRGPASELATLVIDCTGKIVCPGFVDTHHHLWQTQLKGRHADDLLLDYLHKGSTYPPLLMVAAGNITSSLFNPDDVFWGELGGCMEAIDGGVTMVVDHAHINHSAAHSASALEATEASGIRSYFCYYVLPKTGVDSWAPFKFGAPFLAVPDWAASQLAELAGKQPFGDGRVRLGVSFDAYYLAKDVVVSVFETARKLGVKLITSHCVRNAIAGQHSVVNILNSYGLLKDDILLSHASQVLPEDAVLLNAEHAHVSSTPDTELQMAHGTPVCFRPDLYKISSLGVDCHSNNSADILTQMRLALQSARGAHNAPFVAQGKVPRTVAHTVQKVFNLGTILGARAVGMGAEIGSIAVGKLADVVVFDGQSPSMVCAAEHDPVAAIVMHASVRDIETVIVDGKVRKFAGKLVPVDVGAREGEEKPLGWPEVAAKLIHSRRRLQEAIEAGNDDEAREAVITAYGIDKNNVVDHL